MPAFGPPSWLLIVFFRFQYAIELAPAVVLGAAAAATGRYLLALGSRKWRDRMAPERLSDLEALRSELERSKRSSYAGLGLFLVSPLPSAQLFEAAGVTGVPLKPLALAFFCGRLIAYTIYASAAKLASENFEDVLRNGVTSWWSVTLQLLLLAGVVGLAFIPWQRLIERRNRRREDG